ncbi:adenylosuccinate lyase family protein [Plantactinospora sp. KBS50]|uniref:class-II fumarase/aspartase family protein n=1 Tax=Plantactinospora sp. KBS50 TaxID=2024580 RepID=UPI000BAAFC81|nr:adenylosuccinate lyase family protein [Plantactinospora sp. KBS50]ASW54819.1 3-carboxy-cis,cis-muconate cycloisomerase [Plantactinospora sp. KBS50]
MAVTPYDDADVGLLGTVWAGTRVEALTSDRAWLQAMLDAEVALVRAQSRLGSVPAGALPVIAGAAVADRFDLRDLALAARAAANPVVGLVQRLTRAVADTDPAAADYVHRGSTSQDVLDTGTMLIAARCLDRIGADMRRIEAAAAALAERYRDAPMAGRTLAQHAVPVTFGLRAAGWCQAARRAADELDRIRDGLPVQLGGAAGTLAGYLAYAPPEADPGRYAEQLTHVFAEETGLVAPVLPWHTDRTPVVGLAAALAIATGTIGKIAADVRVLSRTEIGELSEPLAEGRGASSAMPQKRNPALSAMVISAALQVGPLVGVLAQAMVAEDERPAGAWHAEWQPLRECLRLAGGAAETAAEIVEGLEVHAERMRDNLGMTGLITTERVAAVLAPILGKATAKSVVGRASAAVAANGSSLGEELPAQPELAGRITADELRDLLEPEGYLGAAVSMVDRTLADRAKNAD